mmetsp:Transcript_88585/g.284367  ORF Transcript_88585/g.284367 Transcript_88585/m.284367 type:complete len:544 (-) Transcript_88585:3985-5616(-)
MGQHVSGDAFPSVEGDDERKMSSMSPLSPSAIRVGSGRPARKVFKDRFLRMDEESAEEASLVNSSASDSDAESRCWGSSVPADRDTSRSSQATSSRSFGSLPWRCGCCKGRRPHRPDLGSPASSMGCHSGSSSGSSSASEPLSMRMNHGDTEEMLRIRRTTGTLQTFDNDNLKKAVAAGLACLSLAYVLQNPPAFIASYLDEVEVNMTRTTAEYPSSFASPDEYDERCDTNSLRFMLNNVESLKASGFTFTRWGTPADMFNILADLLKTMSAVLMQPVASIPNADEFRVHEVHRTDLSLRRSPTNHFVTLGSLVPPPDMLWRHNGRFDWLPTDEAQGLIDLVHRNLPDGVRAVGSEFDPVQSVNQLMRGPHQPNRMVMMPWTVQTALLFFPIQFTQLVWELSAESFFSGAVPDDGAARHEHVAGLVPALVSLRDPSTRTAETTSLLHHGGQLEVLVQRRSAKRSLASPLGVGLAVGVGVLAAVAGVLAGRPGNLVDRHATDVLVMLGMQEVVGRELVANAVLCTLPQLAGCIPGECRDRVPCQ